MKTPCIILVLACAALHSSAQGDSQRSGDTGVRAKGEVVLEADGRLRAPWSIVRVCSPVGSDCAEAIVNAETREIAKVGDQWASPFLPSGKSLEVRRITDPASPIAKGRSSKTPEEPN